MLRPPATICQAFGLKKLGRAAQRGTFLIIESPTTLTKNDAPALRLTIRIHPLPHLRPTNNAT